MTGPSPDDTLLLSRRPTVARRRDVSVTAGAIVDEGRLPSDAASRRAASFVEPLVARLHSEYGGDARTIRTQVADVLAGFAGARVQAFVPILVEKRVREMWRRSGVRPDRVGTPLEDPAASPRMAVVRPLRS